MLNDQKIKHFLNVKERLAQFRQKLLPLLPKERWDAYKDEKASLEPLDFQYKAALDHYWMSDYQGDVEMHIATANHK